MSEKPKYPKPYEYVEDDPAHNAVTGCLCYSCQAKRGYDPYYPPVKSSGETKPDRCPSDHEGIPYCRHKERGANLPCGDMVLCCGNLDGKGYGDARCKKHCDGHGH